MSRSKALDGMTSLNSIPGLATPECPANAYSTVEYPSSSGQSSKNGPTTRQCAEDHNQRSCFSRFQVNYSRLLSTTSRTRIIEQELEEEEEDERMNELEVTDSSVAEEVVGASNSNPAADESW
uniref:Uncharacterized protein n=1 Tax=Ditylenchus dipsaci TaxID=166011 RepID=A0A915CUT3_9BILA